MKYDNRTWMAENLKYMPEVHDSSTVENNKHRYYVYRNNSTNIVAVKDTANYKKYGTLYNWWAAMNGDGSNQSTGGPTGVQGACPPGWSLPSCGEWSTTETWLTEHGYTCIFSGSDPVRQLYHLHNLATQ